MKIILWQKRLTLPQGVGIPLTELAQTPTKPYPKQSKSMILVVAMEKFDELSQIVFLPDDMTVYANRFPVWKFTFGSSASSYLTITMWWVYKETAMNQDWLLLPCVNLQNYQSHDPI